MSAFYHTLRTFPTAFWVLIGATFVNRFGVFVIPFLTLFVSRNGGTPTQAGAVVGAYALGGFGAAWLGGWLADRVGRRQTLAFSAFGSAMCMLAMSQVSDWATLCGVAFITGVISDCGHPSSHALIQDLVGAERRVVAYSVQRFAVNLGWSMGPAVAGFLAERSFTWLFIVDAASSAVFGLVALLFLPDGVKTERHLAGWSHAWQSIRVNRPFLALFAACFGVACLFRQSFTVFPLHYGLAQLPLQGLGYVLASNGLLICLLEVPLAAKTTHWPIRPTLGIGYLVMGTSFLLFLVSSSLSLFFAVMIVFTFGEMMAFSRQQAYAASLTPDHMRGRYAGFLGIAWTLGGAIGSMGGLALYDVSPTLVWVTTPLIAIASATVLIVGSREPPSANLASAEA